MVRIPVFRVRSLAIVVLIGCVSSADAALVGLTGGEGVQSSFYELNPVTGSVVRKIGDTGLTHLSGFAVHPVTGDIYVHQNTLPSDNGRLYRLDSKTFAPTLLGETHLEAEDLAFAPDGTLYGWMGFHDGTAFGKLTIYELVTFDLTTAAATIVGSSPLETFNNGLSFDTEGNLYLKGINGTLVGTGFEYHSEVYQLDLATGASTLVTQLQDAATGDDVYPDGVLAMNGTAGAFTVWNFYNPDNSSFTPVFDQSYLQYIDFASGDVTTIGGDLGLPFTSLAFTSLPSAVPEPASGSVVALAVLAIVHRVRSRRSTSKSNAEPA